jgi:hypothetical protein
MYFPFKLFQGTVKLFNGKYEMQTEIVCNSAFTIPKRFFRTKHKTLRPFKIFRRILSILNCQNPTKLTKHLSEWWAQSFSGQNKMHCPF